MVYALATSLLIILTYVHKIGGKSDYYSSKWGMLLLIGALFLSYKIWKKYHWSAAFVFGYFSISSINIFSNYANQYESYNYISKLVLMQYGAVGLVSYILIYFLVNEIKQKDYAVLNNFLGLVCLVDALYVILQWYLGYTFPHIGGLWANVGVNGVFIAVLCPFLFNSRLKYLFPVVIASILLSKTSVALGTLCVVLGSYCLLQTKYGLLKRCLLCITIVASLFFVASRYDADLYSDSRRFELYKAYVAQFSKQEKTFSKTTVKYLTGWGVGSFPLQGVISQQKFGAQDVGWAQWAHSDWLQLFLEGGLIGFILCVNLFMFVLWRSRKDAVLCSQVLGYGASMVFLYPVHYPIHAFFMLYLIKRSFCPRSKLTLSEPLCFF